MIYHLTVSRCIDCVMLKGNGWCAHPNVAQTSGEYNPRFVDASQKTPPDWCPLRREKMRLEVVLEK